MAKINEQFESCNFLSPATNILIAESISVPEHNSSPRIRLVLFADFNIIRNSDISTMNVDIPLNKLSLPKILVKMLLYGIYSNDEHGTYKPA